MVTIAVINTKRVEINQKQQVYCDNNSCNSYQNNCYTRFTEVTIAVNHIRNSPYTRIILITIAVIHTRTRLLSGFLW